MGEMTERLQNVHKTLEKMGKMSPDAMKGFMNFRKSVKEGGALDPKTKELIALGASITAKCKYCIPMHVKGSLDAGATEEEIYETAMVAVLMGGSPAMGYVSEVREALEEFTG